jgi:hypothetical protein
MRVALEFLTLQFAEDTGIYHEEKLDLKKFSGTVRRIMFDVFSLLSPT